MKNKLNFKLLIFFLSIITIGSYFFVNLSIGKDRFKILKLVLDNEQKILIKKYLFSYKFISQQSQTISQQSQTISQQSQTISQQSQTISQQSQTISQQSQSVNKISIKAELYSKQTGDDIEITENIINLSNNLKLKKYLLISGFYSGIQNQIPGSGYIDFHRGGIDNVVIISSRGLLAYREILTDDKIKFRQIKNNINEFIGINQFNKNIWFSIKDIFIFNNKVFVSYTEEIKEDCWNTSVIFGNMNYENIEFTKLFSAKDCIHSRDNIDKEFNAHQSGGRIISFNNSHILLSIGDYRNRHLAQNKKSINGKIIKINIDSGDYEIISMGHRSPQGLYFDKENNFILETEHGPQGGDEINLIDVNEIKKDKIQNYGWAISSAGEHYGGKVEGNKTIYEKYPLYKSHSEKGFIEPLKSFVPSIGISEIVKIGQNRYVVSSMRDKSLYFFELNEQKQIINLNRVEVFERVRDLRFNDNQLYLFMEDTASIGVINLN